MTNDNFIQLKRIFGRLMGLRQSLPSENFKAEIGNDFNSIVIEIGNVLNEDLESYKIPTTGFYQGVGSRFYCFVDIAESKIQQLISYLDYGYGLGEKIQQIGSLVSSISDAELRDRCLDLLNASSNFDRVINQATLILEDRLRKKSKLTENLEGVKLVNKVLNPDITKTILLISNNSDEQQGFCDMVRGVMLYFRNPTHHKLREDFSREDALKICEMIDILLSVVNTAKLKSS